jgi:hypothetical protein
MWYYNDEPYEIALGEYQGFVYCITELTSNKMYIGKKGFWSKKTLPPLKGKTRKRKSIVESDWMKYYGSSEVVKQLLLEHGADNFRRDILYLCKSKAEMGYLEAKEQFDRNVLLDDRYYNGIINCKVHRNHIKGLHSNHNGI